MDAAIQDYIKRQPEERQALLSGLHETIVKNDPHVSAVIELMMGKEMILYKGRKMMKYGLSSVKQYMSLHVMPIYMNPPLHGKYQTLLSQASFQKGCINFTSAQQMPLEIVAQLIATCSPLDLDALRETYEKNRKAGKK